ncbi:MAG TPA: M23 family metallopeptidase [Gemmatimonadales bacterium]|jgi:murein DD-endopeptidase MepM/ murein hydrolase activator NlpD
MSRPRRAITIVLHRDGEPESHSLRLPLWLARASVTAIAVFLALVVVAGTVYAPIARTAARVPGLSRDLERLRQENAQVRELAATLEAVEGSYDQLREMLGGDVVPSRSRFDAAPAVAYPIVADLPSERVGTRSWSERPLRWPLEGGGVVTRGPVDADRGGGAHSGMDVAVPVGTPIRAAGAGVVVDARSHVEYGLYVRLRHNPTTETMYGHASRLLVQRGETVRIGQVIALSGSTGRSTAPHLHFEVFRDGASIDPRHMIPEEL